VITSNIEKRVAAWLPSLLWASLIFYLSSRSEMPEPSFWLPPFADKIVHAGLYAILAGLLYPAFRLGGFNPIRAACLALLFASLFGATDEWHQSFVAKRSSDVWDWVADTVGASWVFILARHEHLVMRWWKKLAP
jgi:VanZ family protein